MDLDNPVLRAIRSERGLAGRLGKELGITREAVFMWRRVPPRHAIRVAQMLKLPMHEVCPEVWPKKPHGKKKPPEDSPCDVIR